MYYIPREREDNILSSRLTDHLLRSPRPGPPPKGPACEPHTRPAGHDGPLGGAEDARPGPNALRFYPVTVLRHLRGMGRVRTPLGAEEGATCGADDSEAEARASGRGYQAAGQGVGDKYRERQGDR
jgi:hypothetical protein